MALIVIPYFKVNIEAEGLFLKDRAEAAAHLLRRSQSALSLFLPGFKCVCGAGPDA